MENLNPTLTNLLIATIAAWQAVETWHHGSVFGGIRDWLWGYRVVKERPWASRKLAELLTCPFCLSHWACACTAAVMFATEEGSWWRFPVYCLAMTRVAQLANDIAHTVTRSPSSETEVDLTDETAMTVMDE